MPTYIHGPAIVRRGGISIYFADGLNAALRTKTDKVNSDLHGQIDEYVVSRMLTIRGRPVDAIANLSAFFGQGIGNIGDSIFAAAPLNIASISAANPAVVTFTAPHQLGPVGTTIAGTIAGTTTTPTVTGVRTVTVTGASTVTVPVDVSSGQAGAAGTFTPDSVPLQIVSRNDAAIYTYERSAVLRPPTLHLGATKGIFASDLEFAVLGSVRKTPVDAGYWKQTASAAFSDATFDQSKFRRYRYTAAYGASPFDAIRAQSGFEVVIEHETEELPDDNFGVGDIILKSVTAASKFTPSNLTEAEINQLLRLQDADALLPGASVAGAGTTDLVISGTDADGGFSVTLYGHGFRDAELRYKVGTLRAGEIAGISRRTWTSGTANPLYALTIT